MKFPESAFSPVLFGDTLKLFRKDRSTMSKQALDSEKVRTG